MNLESILFTQGFGSRRQCRALIGDARVSIQGAICTDADADFAVDSGALRFSVDGIEWPYREHAYLLLNKPAGYECSRDPQHHLCVFSLLPPQFAERGVQCVGRLDQDTTGLLLLSDDGKFVHQFTSPKRKVPKLYVATTRHPLDDAQLAALRDGVLLHGETRPSAALEAQARDTHTLALTVLEGKYHQVKRMIAASGNRCEALHRERIGGLALPASLAPGAWQWLDDTGLAALRAG
ncbi:pseudouridine synthase [Paraburkholderia sp. MMS20-SJTN17]|uniref:Pseudouridine synthase n=1 Tax=Paraburkholderia translucens TaxID=2886945 RepID=A0ABS8KGP0_9BURK|nr:16S rRNA pseudouridine(516) synthase [Paraburkholderia sp. MMS20-SJTN17]MCC8403931.1 pseudouridine synthase [Paraburkholderia sp. MMS20-SJTN17]